MATVPFTVETTKKCKCPVCPVQTQSRCVASLKNGLVDALTRIPLRKAEIPGVYCGTGKASCLDLDIGKYCICGTCDVYVEYGLGSGKPDIKFCANGMAT